MTAKHPSWIQDSVYWEAMRHAKLGNRQALKEELLRLKQEGRDLRSERLDFILKIGFESADNITSLMRLRDILKAFPEADRSIMRDVALRCRDFRSLLLARREFGMFTDSEIVERACVEDLLKVFNRKKAPSGSRSFRDDRWIKEEVRKIPDLLSFVEVGKVLDT